MAPTTTIDNTVNHFSDFPLFVVLVSARLFFVIMQYITDLPTYKYSLGFNRIQIHCSHIKDVHHSIKNRIVRSGLSRLKCV
jgi:hypothetical protein